MRRILGIGFGLVFLLPINVQAQTWTPVQQEVWDALEACWTSRDAQEISDCYHADYKAFVTSRNVPRDKVDAVASLPEWLETTEMTWDNLMPMSITVRGDMAVVLYVSDWQQRNRLTGEITRGTTNWTEVFVKEDGRWQCLTDHGTTIGGG